MTDATQLLPKLKPAEFEALKESIRRDGVIVPIVVRSNGDMIDGHHRRAIAEDLGVDCPTKVVDIDDETADRWRLILNLARRHLEEWERLDMIAALVRPIYEAEKAKAKQRKADGGRSAGRGRPAQQVEAGLTSTYSRAPQARDVAAARLAEEIERVGAPIAAVGGQTIEKALAWAALADKAPELRHGVTEGKATPGEAIKTAKQREKRKAAQEQEQEARESTLAEVMVDATGPGWRLLAGDFRERLLDLPAGCVDLIVTDPPYPTESLPLYGDLARIARHVLAEDGICVVLTGQISLDRVMALMTEHLRYGWCYVQPLPGSHSRIMGRHVLQTWKPWVAFTKNQWPSGRIDWHADTLEASWRVKDDYRWQQDPEPARLLIDALCPEGGTICDPFTGTGSYGLVALDMGRQFIGVELDEGRFDLAKEKLCTACATPTS